MLLQRYERILQCMYVVSCYSAIANGAPLVEITELGEKTLHYGCSGPCMCRTKGRSDLRPLSRTFNRLHRNSRNSLVPS